MHAIMRAVGVEDWVRIFARSTGVARSLTGNRIISYGTPGAGDLWAIVRRRRDKLGVHVEIECKSGNAKLNKQQVLFQKMVLQMGGKYLIARDAANIKAELIAIRDEGLGE